MSTDIVAPGSNSEQQGKGKWKSITGMAASATGTGGKRGADATGRSSKRASAPSTSFLPGVLHARRSWLWRLPRPPLHARTPSPSSALPGSTEGDSARTHFTISRPSTFGWV